jgi:hypothetical protein
VSRAVPEDGSPSLVEPAGATLNTSDNDATQTCHQKIAHFIPKRTDAKACMTPRVKYILSPSEIPAGQSYVLVRYGDTYEQARHPLGLTITVARQKSKTVSELSFLTAVHTAKGLGKREGISEIFACK